MDINIDKNSKIPVYLQIINEMKGKILSGELVAGQDLPSIRMMANMLHLHRNTVARAYGELEAEGLIQCIPGLGCKVRRQRSYGEKDCDQEKASSRQKVNWLAQIREEYLDMKVNFDDLFQRIQGDDVISMGSSIASPEIYDERKMAEVLAFIVSDKRKIQNVHCPYKGDKTLRANLVKFLATKGVKASIGNIQVMPEINQALDFVVTLLVGKGDTVIIEEPISPDVYRIMELAGANIRTIPVDEEGMNPLALEKMVQQLKPKLIFVSSSYNDPTGVILPVERRQKIVDISNRYQIPIIEEDVASELVYRGKKQQPLKAYDTGDNVIYIYSFYLTFVPGQSMAFVVANKEIVKRISYLVSMRMIYVNGNSQKLIARFLQDGSYEIALEKLRQTYGKKQEIVCNALDKMKDMGISYKKPDGGVLIWCKLPKGLDSKAFINIAYQKGITLYPGYVFYPRQNGGRDYIRICYSYETEERLQKGMIILRQILEEELN